MSFNREFKINEDQVADFLESAIDKVKTSLIVDTVLILLLIILRKI